MVASLLVSLMYILAHILVGILIGVVLAGLIGNRRIVALTAFGAVLPDLIDKPLGHIVLAGTINYGRLYFHGLTTLFLISLAGLLLYRYRRRFDIIAVSVGIASHQILDGMWHNPAVWFWPLLGPIPGRNYSEDYLWSVILRNLAQPSEWISLVLIIGLVAIFYRHELKSLIGRSKSPSILLAIAALFILAALVAGLWFLV